MRALLLFAVLMAAGCGSKEGAKGGDPPKAGKYETKLAATDLITHNVFGPKPHPAEGKRVLVLVSSNFSYMTKDGEGKPCLLFDSKGGFSRPLAVFRLTKDSIFADGKSLLGTDRVEADFAGHVGESAKWFSPWAAMERRNSNGLIILFDNARIVSE
jgi:hypothetical protein